MHKFFTLALVSIPLFASISTFAAIDDTQVIDRESTPVSDITPTEGQNMNVIKDFVDNMGKFSKKKKGR